ncbi:hypothetical protein [Streptomyces sp. NPDC055134]
MSRVTWSPQVGATIAPDDGTSPARGSRPPAELPLDASVVGLGPPELHGEELAVCPW